MRTITSAFATVLLGASLLTATAAPAAATPAVATEPAAAQQAAAEPAAQQTAAQQTAADQTAADQAADCGDLRRQAATLAAKGHSGPATRVRKKPTESALQAADACGGSSVMSRGGSCVVEDGLLVIFLVPNGQVIGTIEYTVSSLTTLYHNDLRWTQSFNYRGRFITGAQNGPAVTNTYIYAEPVCLAGCNVSSSGLIGGLATPGTPTPPSATSTAR